MFEAVKDQRRFEENTLRFLNALAQAMSRYRVLGCLRVDINVTQSSYASWSRLIPGLKRHLRDEMAARMKAQEAARPVGSWVGTLDTPTIDHFATKQYLANEEVIYQTVLFFDGEALSVYLSQYDEREIETFLGEAITAFLNKTLTVPEPVEVAQSREASVEFLRLHRREASLVDGLFYLLIASKPMLLQRGFEPRQKGEARTSMNKSSFTFDTPTLSWCFHQLYQYDEVTRYRPSSSSGVVVIQCSAALSGVIDLLPVTHAEMSKPGALTLMRDHYPLADQAVTVTPTASVDEPVSTGVAVSGQAHQPPYLVDVLSMLSRLEAAGRAETLTTPKSVTVGSVLHLVLFQVEQEGKTHPVGIDTVLVKLGECGTRDELAAALGGERITLQVYSGSVIKLHDGIATIRFFNNNAEVMLNNACYCQENTTFTHDYTQRGLYRWQHNRGVSLYELEFVLHWLLKQPKGKGFFIQEGIDTLDELCEHHSDAAQQIRERFTWLRLYYREKTV